LIYCIFDGRVFTLYRFIIDLGFQKFKRKNLQMFITFDRELGLDAPKMKVARNNITKLVGNT